MDPKWYLLVSSLIAVAIASPRRSKPTLFGRPLYMRARYAELCHDSPPDIVRTDKVSLTYDGPKVFVSAIVTFLRDVNTINKAIVTIRRCRDAAEEVNCELFQTWRFGKESCTMIEQKNMLWSPLFYAIEPNFKCPIKKGVYELNNGTFDLSSIQNVFGAALLEKHFWRVRIVTLDDDGVFVCLMCGLSFLRGKA